MLDEAPTLTDSTAVKPPAPNAYSDIAAQLYAPPTESNRQTESAGDYQVQFSLQGKNREFEYHVPRGYDGSHAIPIMYVLHGVDGSIEEIKPESGLNQIADQKGFAVAYLQALPKETSWGFLLPDFTSWNLQHGSITKYDPSYDDLNYVKEAMNKVGQQIKVDPAAQYLYGHSEGGGAAQYIAEMMPGTFAGIASICGTYLKDNPKPITNDPTSIVTIHGDDDNMVPISGGHGWFEAHGQGWLGFSFLKGFMTFPFSKMADSEPLQQAPNWASTLGCNASATTNSVKDKVTSYTCPAGETITDIIHHGGQHTIDNGSPTPDPSWWPFVEQPDPTENDTALIVDRLLKFRKPGKY